MSVLFVAHAGGQRQFSRLMMASRVSIQRRFIMGRSTGEEWEEHGESWGGSATYART